MSVLSWLYFVTFFPTCFSAQPFLLPFHSVPILSYCTFVHNPCSKNPQHLLPLYFTPLTRPFSPLHVLPLQSVCFSQPLPPQHPCSLSRLLQDEQGSWGANACPTSSQSLKVLCWPLPVLSTGRFCGPLKGSAMFRCAPLQSLK